MKYHLLTICLLFLITANSCNGPKEIPTEQPARSFILGSGGGFTGAYTTYQVHNDGRVEELESDNVSYTIFKQIPLDSAKACFKALDAMALEDYRFNHPHNMTFYITLRSGETQNEIKWGDANFPIREDINRFFDRIRTMIAADY